MALAADDPYDYTQLARQPTRTTPTPADADLSNRLADYHNRYWWMDPEASWSLAQAGVDAGDPAAQTAAMAAAHQNQMVGGAAFTGYGQRVAGPSIYYDPAAAQDYLGPITRQSGPGVSPSNQPPSPPGMGLRQWVGVNPSQLKESDFESFDYQMNHLSPADRQALQNIRVVDVPTDKIPSGAEGGVVLTGLDNLSADGLNAVKGWVANRMGVNRDTVTVGGLDYQSRLQGDRSSGAFIFGSKIQRPDKGAIGDMFAATQIIGEGIPPLGAALKTGFLAANAPLQEIQGQVRNVYGALHQQGVSWLEPQSDFGIATQKVLQGEKVDMGGGVFVDPTSPLAQERTKREQERGMLPGGHVFSLGRQAANMLFEPGSRPYELLSGLVDATTAIKADPVAWGLKYNANSRLAEATFRTPNAVAEGLDAFRSTGQMSSAVKAFYDAGGLSGIRKTIDPAQVESYLTSPETLPVLEGLDRLPDSYSVWRATNRRMDPAATNAIVANTEGPAAVADILRGQLGLKVNRIGMGDVTPGALSVPGLPNLDKPVLGFKPPSGFTNMLPQKFVDGTSPAANALTLERAAVYTKMTDKLPEWFDAMANATTESERQGVWQDVAAEAYNRGMAKAVKRADLLPWVTDANRDAYLANAAENWRRLARLQQSSEAADSLYITTAIGRGQGTFDPAIVLDGEPHVIGQSPQIMAQGRNGRIPLPDWRGINQGLSAWSPVLTNPAFRIVNDAVLGTLQNVVWKSLVIAKPATALKVVADEQASIAGRGFRSLFNGPLSALSIVLGGGADLPADTGFFDRLAQLPSRGVRWTAEHLPGVEAEGRIATNYENIPFDQLNDWRRLMGQGVDRAADDPLGVITADNWSLLHRNPGVNDAPFARAWHSAVAELAASDDVKLMVRQPSLAEAQDMMWDGAGKPIRLKWAAGPGRSGLLDRATSDAWVQRTLEYVDDLTHGDPELRAAIADGELDSTPLWRGHVDGSPQLNPDATAAFADRLDAAPLVVKDQRALYSGPMARTAALAKHYFDRFLHGMISIPSATLSKSPLYRQAYWQWAVDHAAYLTDTAQEHLLTLANGDARLGPDLTGRLQAAIDNSRMATVPFTGTVDVARADQMASGFALDTLRRTTHDFSERNQFMDALRVLSPFGEALRKGWKRYVSIAGENPQAARRVQQIYQAAHSPELNDLLGGDPNEGFFHKDSYGEEVFTIPGSAFADQALGGVNVPGVGPLGSGLGVPLVGHVRGLSLGTEVFPSVGPAASFPVAWTLDQLHAGPSITDTVFPYGAPRGWSDIGTYLPGWFVKFVGHDRDSSPEAVSAFNSAVKDVVSQGVVEGRYHVGTPEGMSAAIEDATSRAHGLFRVRAISQFLAPGAPSAQILATDPSGKIWDLQALGEDFRRLQTGVDEARQRGENPPSAGQQFLDRYGVDLFRAITPKTWSYAFHLPTTRDSAAWLNDHPDVKASAPDLFGYFTPPSDPAEFDYNTYLDQLLPGQGREQLTALQWVRVSNSKLAAQIYANQRDKVLAVSDGKAPDAGQRAWLANVKQTLVAQYPGYSGDSSTPDVPGIAARQQPAFLVTQALSVAGQPTIAGTEAGQGLAVYAEQWNKVDKLWTDADPTHRSGGWMQSSGDWALGLRNWLRGVGEKVTVMHPAFGPLFEDIFDRAMRDDVQPATGG